MSARRAIAVLVVLLVGCIDLPASTVPQSPSDRAAVDAAIEALTEARGRLAGCAILERVDVISLPFDGPPPTIQDKCIRRSSSPAHSCVYVVQRYVGAAGSTVVYVRDDADARTRAALLIHEVLHVARGCWIQAAAADPYGEYRRRWDLGETEQCSIPWGTDAYHCDRELWTTVERDAVARWERSR